MPDKRHYKFPDGSVKRLTVHEAWKAGVKDSPATVKEVIAASHKKRDDRIQLADRFAKKKPR